MMEHALPRGWCNSRFDSTHEKKGGIVRRSTEARNTKSVTKTKRICVECNANYACGCYKWLCAERAAQGEDEANHNIVPHPNLCLFLREANFVIIVSTLCANITITTVHSTKVVLKMTTIRRRFRHRESYGVKDTLYKATIPMLPFHFLQYQF
jgi:hypothetical protein